MNAFKNVDIYPEKRNYLSADVNNVYDIVSVIKKLMNINFDRNYNCFKELVVNSHLHYETMLRHLNNIYKKNTKSG